MSQYDPPRRRRRGGGGSWIRIQNPIQFAFAILAVAMVLCMIASTCLQPF